MTVDRASSKHGPRIDDEMEKETNSLIQGAAAEARAGGERRKEGPGDDQPPVQEVLNRTEADVADHYDPRKEARRHGR